MSKIDDLIRQYCPNGVEYKKLSKICIRQKGTPITATIMKKLNTPQAPIRIFAGGNTFADVNYGDIPDKDIITKTSIIVKSRGNIGFEFYTKPFSHKNEMWSYSSNNKDINLKFVYYYLTNKINDFQLKAKTGKLPQISTPDTDNYLIPIPPLPVQEEIVKVLDAFTALEAELEAELEARKRQYEYYRNKLLTFDENTTEGGKIKFMQLGDVGTFIRGNGLQKKDFTDTGVGCIHYGQIYTYYGTFAERTKSYVSNELAEKLKKARTGDLIIATTSENVEDVGKAVAWLGNEDICIGGHSYAFHHNQNPKYMAYLFQTEAFNQQKKKVVKGVKVIDINDSAMSKFKFGFPPLDEQERIVAILDKFDSLVNDISEGLPAELTARRQQYEYYRNKLLTFDEAA